MSAALLEACADASNRHDIEALLGMMAEDYVFDMAAGPKRWGTRPVGKEALRDALPDRRGPATGCCARPAATLRPTAALPEAWHGSGLPHDELAAVPAQVLLR